jgi:hypothetical protein
MLSNNSGGPVTNAMGIADSKITYNNYDGNWQTRQGNTNLSLNTWYHLTWVNQSNNTITMYVNGAADSSALGSYTTNGGPVNAIGRNWFSYFSGRVASVVYYDTNLTAAQILSNFNAVRGKFGI